MGEQSTITALDFSSTDQSIWGPGAASDAPHNFTLLNAPWNFGVGGFSLSGDLALNGSFSAADSGSVNVSYPVDSRIVLPTILTPGQNFTIETDEQDLRTPSLQTSFLGLDAISLGAMLTADASGSLPPVGSFHVGPVSLQATLLDLSAASPQLTPLDLGVASLSANVPGEVDTDSTSFDPDATNLLSITSSGIGSNFLSLSGDVIGLILKILGVAEDPLDITFPGGSLTALAADLSVGLSLAQQFTFIPTGIDVDITPSFDPSQEQSKPLGSPFTFHVPADLSTAASLSATYTLTGELATKTGVGGDLSLNLDAGAVSAGPFSSSPIVHAQIFDLPSSKSLYLYQPAEFSLGGFNSQSAIYTIPVDLAQNPTPVTAPPISSGPTPTPVVSPVAGRTSVSYAVGQEIPLSSLFSAAEQPAGSGQSPVAYDLLLPQAGGGQFVIGGKFYTGDVTNVTNSDIAGGFFWTGNSPGTNQIDVIAIDGAGQMSTPVGIAINVTAAAAPVVTPPATSGVGPLIDNSAGEPVVNVGGSIVLTGQDLYALDQGVPTTFSQMVYTVATPPMHGTLKLSGVAKATFTQADLNNGLVSYAENGDNTTADSFQYYVTDASDDQSALTTYHLSVLQTATVSAVPNPTLVNDSELTVGVGQTIVLTDKNLEVTDEGLPSWQLIYTVTQGPSLGTVGAAAVGTFTQQELDLGLVWYKSDGHSAGADRFTFTVSNGHGGIIGPAALDIDVIPHNNLRITSLGTLYTNPGANAPGFASVLDSSLLSASDPGVDPINVVYTVDSMPVNAEGFLVGQWGTTASPTFNGDTFGPGDITDGRPHSFTQADVNAGRVFYRQFYEIGNGESLGEQFPIGLSVSDGLGNSLSDIVLPLVLEPRGIVSGGTFTAYSTAFPVVSFADSVGQAVTLGPELLTGESSLYLPGQITFTLQRLPQYGSVLLGDTVLSLHGTFTQSDVDEGRVTYSEDGSPAASDQLELFVSDPGATNWALVFMDVDLQGTDGGSVLADSSGASILYSGPGNNWVIGHDGATALSYVNAPAGVSVNLATGTASNGFGGTDTISGISTVIGSAYDDVLVGGSSSSSSAFTTATAGAASGESQTFFGGAGNNTITGGTDTMSTAGYADPLSDYQITYDDGALTVNGPSNVDALANIQTLQFADAALTTLSPDATTAVSQFDDSTGTGHIFINSGTTVAAGAGSAFAPAGLVLGGEAGGEGDATIIGTGASLTNVGPLIIGDLGFGACRYRTAARWPHRPAPGQRPPPRSRRGPAATARMSV